jgi:hypothetical protein
MIGGTDSAEVYELAKRRCGSQAGRFVEVTSCDGAGEVPDNSFDLVFIDVAGGFRDVRNAIRTWWPKLRPGGILAGSRYATSAEVAAAVHGFVTLQQVEHAFRPCGGSWLIYKSLRIDAAYCINLRHRPDRRASAIAQFRAAGVRPPVWVIDAVDGRRLQHPGVISDGQAGCSASHLQVMRTAALRGYKHILIFEDDVELEDNFMASFNRALARCPASYDMLLIGATCHSDWGTYLHPMDDLLARAGRVYGNHAYVANLDRLAEIDGALKDRRTIFDVWHADVMQTRGDVYVCVPYLAHQKAGQSNISNSYMDASRTWSQYVWR